VIEVDKKLNPKEVGRMRGRTRALRITTAIAFLGVLATLGCGSYSPLAPSIENPSTPGVTNPDFATLLPASKDDMIIMRSSVASSVIKADEGGVVTNGYYSLYFPPGALEEDTEITIEMPEFPKAIVRLGPHGIQFKKAVILSIPLDRFSGDADSYTTYWYNEASGKWVLIGGYVEDGMVKTELEHFSEYGLTDKY